MRFVYSGRVRYVAGPDSTGYDLRSAAAVSNDNRLTKAAGVLSRYSLLAREPEDELIPAAIDCGADVFDTLVEMAERVGE